MKRLLFAAVGNPGCGKTTVARHLVENHDFEITGVSGVIRRYAIDNSLPLENRLDYSNAHTRLVEDRGPDYLIDTIVANPAQRICVDGLRAPYYAQRLQSYGGIVVALECPLEPRHARALARGHGKDNISLEVFGADEATEYRNGDPLREATLTVMEMANYRLDTSVPPAVTLAQIDTIVESLLS